MRTSPARNFLTLPALVLALLAMPTHAQLLYFALTTDDEIYSAPSDGSGTPMIVVSPATGFSAGPVGFDIDFGNGLIYVNDGNNRNTYVQPLDGTGSPTLVPNSGGGGGGSGPTGEHFALELDLPNSRYFFTTDSTDGLWVHNTDGTGTPFQIASDGVDNFHGMDYDPATDTVYAGDTDGDNQIWRYNADGTGGTLLYDGADGVLGVRAIALDTASGRMFWGQHDNGASGTGSILSAPITGAGTPVVHFTNAGRVFPAGMQISNGKLYWTEFDADGGTSEVLSADILSGGTALGARTVLYSGLGARIRGIVVTGGSAGPTSIPALPVWGLITLALLMLGAGGRLLQRRTTNRRGF